MADVAIVNRAIVSAPKDYVLAPSQELVLKAVRAVVDGSGAASSFLPTLQLVAPDGTVMWEGAPSLPLAAGASADVSWFPFVTQSNGGGGPPQAFLGATIRASAAGQNIPNNTNTDLTYASVEVDTNGMANLAADDRILTVRTAGYYLVMVGTTWGYNNSGRRISLIFQNDYYSNPLAQSKVADSRMEPWDPFPGEGVGGSADNLAWRILHAAVGDFFSSGVFQNSGATINCNSGPNPGAFLSAVLLGV